MKKSLLVTEDERQRILEMHGFNNKVNVINEQYKELENIFVKDFLKGLEKTDAKTFDELGVIISKRSDETLSGAFDRILTSAINGGRQEGIQVLKFCRTLSAVNDKFAEKFYKTQIKTIDKIKLKYPEKWEDLVKTNFGEKVLEKYKKGAEGKVTPPKPSKPSTPPVPPKEIPSKLDKPVKFRTSSGKEITVKQKDVDKAIDDATAYISEHQLTNMDEAQTLDIWNSFKNEIKNLKPGDLIDSEGILFRTPKSTEFFNKLLRLSKANPKILPKAEKDEVLQLLQKNLSDDEKTVINSIWQGVQKNEVYLNNLPEKFRWVKGPLSYIKKNKKKFIYTGLGGGALYEILDGDSALWSFLKTIGLTYAGLWVVKTLFDGGGATPDDFKDEEDFENDKKPGGGKEVG
jgi:hypothetical protein